MKTKSFIQLKALKTKALNINDQNFEFEKL